MKISLIGIIKVFLVINMGIDIFHIVMYVLSKQLVWYHQFMMPFVCDRSGISSIIMRLFWNYFILNSNQ